MVEDIEYRELSATEESNEAALGEESIGAAIAGALHPQGEKPPHHGGKKPRSGDASERKPSTDDEATEPSGDKPAS